MFVVAGATGRTGRVVAETLLAEGQKVRVLVRDAGRGAAWGERGAEVAALSLADGAALARALEGTSGFYTLLPEEMGVDDFHGHRRRLADVIAGAVAASRTPHVVLLSAGPAALPDGNGPAKDLHYAENALRATGVTLTALRASYFQENVLAALAPAQSNGIYPSFLPSADLEIPMVATRDVGRLAARCLREPPAESEIVDLVGPMYSARQLAEKLGAALGKSLRTVDIPPRAQVDVLMTAGLPRQVAEAVAEMYACFAAGRVKPEGDRMVAGTTELEDILPDLTSSRG